MIGKMKLQKGLILFPNVWAVYKISSTYHTQENVGMEKMANLMNRELFAKIFLTNTLKMYLAYALTVAYSPNFCLPIAFTCMVCQKFPMYGMIVHILPCSF